VTWLARAGDRIAKVGICAGRRPLYAAVAQGRDVLIGKSAAGMADRVPAGTQRK